MVIGSGGPERANAAEVRREYLRRLRGHSAMFTRFRVGPGIFSAGRVVALCLMFVSGVQAQQARMADSGRPASAVAADDLGPGCAPGRPAVAHHQGGLVVKTSEPAPVPCLTSTGYAAAESRLAVSKANTVFYVPAYVPREGGAADRGGQFATGGFPVRSTDRGGHWRLVENTSIKNLDAHDGDIKVDPRTGRIFQLSRIFGNGRTTPRDGWHVFWSDDDGVTWSAMESCADCPIGIFDFGRIFTAPPPPDGLQPTGYPDIVYFCGTRDGHARQCAKSLDGGKNFRLVSKLPNPPDTYVPPHPWEGDTFGLGCGTYGAGGVADADGTIYVAYEPCNTPYIGISRDEGQTWQPVQISKMLAVCVFACAPGVIPALAYAPGTPQVGIDAKGNLYATFIGLYDGVPHLSISSDHGQHWGIPMNVLAPGLKQALLSDVAVSPDGKIAIEYWGTSDGPGPPYGPQPCVSNLGCSQYMGAKWDLYLTYTTDPLSKDPLFWSASLNGPNVPLWIGCPPGALVYGTSCDGGVRGAGRIDYAGAAIGPDGTPWAGSAIACPPEITPSKFCPANLPNRYVGLVGRLALPKNTGGLVPSGYVAKTGSH
jgi:hypothetical protein